MIDRNLLNSIFNNKLDVKRWSKILEEKPEPYLPIVTKSDIERKFIDRYFVRSANDKGNVTEVDQVQYQNFVENPRFVAVRLKWKIVGKKETDIGPTGIVNRGVREHNQEEVKRADVLFKVLYKYITDYTQLWVAEFNPTNVYTPELKNY